MNKLTSAFNALYMSVIFCNVLPMQGMESTFVKTMADKPDLFKFFVNNYSSDKLKCCLEGCADVTKVNDAGFCLLHQLICLNCYAHIADKDDFLKKGELLLHAIPGMINALNRYGETPTDYAYMGWKTTKYQESQAEAFGKLIYLYKSHGGKTAQQLLKENMILLLHNDSCVGGLTILPHDVRKYIVEYMMLYFKKQVTEEVPNDPYDCSICRSAQEKNKKLV